MTKNELKETGIKVVRKLKSVVVKIVKAVKGFVAGVAQEIVNYCKDTVQVAKEHPDWAAATLGMFVGVAVSGLQNYRDGGNDAMHQLLEALHSLGDEESLTITDAKKFRKNNKLMTVTLRKTADAVA